jgi:ABC-2 type transport system ATP-binding protein
MENIITTHMLTKRYGDFYALRNLSLEVRRGEVFGLLGPNGSGKTTTIRTLLGLIKATSGHGSVAGCDCWHDSLQVRERVSYLPGELRMFGYLTGYRHLKFFCELRGNRGYDRAVYIAEQVLSLDLKKKVRQYSTGMKQKLALAQAFADPVEILILDEPTSALDPSARGLVLDLVLAAKAQGQTVIFSGHVLSEVERISDRVAIMKKPPSNSPTISASSCVTATAANYSSNTTANYAACSTGSHARTSRKWPSEPKTCAGFTTNTTGLISSRAISPPPASERFKNRL